MINLLNSLRHKKIGRKLLAILIIAPIVITILTGFINTNKQVQQKQVKYQSYVVSASETIWDIACNIKHNNKLNKDIRDIQDDIIVKNNIKNSIINKNQTILIPIY